MLLTIFCPMFLLWIAGARSETSTTTPATIIALSGHHDIEIIKPIPPVVIATNGTNITEIVAHNNTTTTKLPSASKSSRPKNNPDAKMKLAGQGPLKHQQIKVPEILNSASGMPIGPALTRNQRQFGLGYGGLGGFGGLGYGGLGYGGLGYGGLGYGGMGYGGFGGLGGFGGGAVIDTISVTDYVG